MKGILRWLGRGHLVFTASQVEEKVPSKDHPNSWRDSLSSIKVPCKHYLTMASNDDIDANIEHEDNDFDQNAHQVSRVRLRLPR